ncbi:hypothetical protein Hanom_Chr00s000001g01595641 [Helianthus anomalus]
MTKINSPRQVFIPYFTITLNHHTTTTNHHSAKTTTTITTTKKHQTTSLHNTTPPLPPSPPPTPHQNHAHLHLVRPPSGIHLVRRPRQLSQPHPHHPPQTLQSIPSHTLLQQLNSGLVRLALECHTPPDSDLRPYPLQSMPMWRLPLEKM